MNTITIEDPAEVKEQLRSEFPHASFVGASYANFADGNQWILSVYVHDPKMDINGSGKSAKEALEHIRKVAAEHDPAARIREQAAKLGMKLVPA